MMANDAGKAVADTASNAKDIAVGKYDQAKHAVKKAVT